MSSTEKTVAAMLDSMGLKLLSPKSRPWKAGWRVGDKASNYCWAMRRDPFAQWIEYRRIDDFLKALLEDIVDFSSENKCVANKFYKKSLDEARIMLDLAQGVYSNVQP